MDTDEQVGKDPSNHLSMRIQSQPLDRIDCCLYLGQ